jgi:hypothetical protein
MKRLNFFKTLLFLVTLLGATGVVNAQIHPLAFGSRMLGTTATASNFYKDYVGVRLEVTAPAVIAGDKMYKTANDGGGGTGVWGGVVTTPLINLPVVLVDPDSFACGSLTAPAFPAGGWIALLWRGPIGSPCEFGYKALQAQTAGAAAVVIINEYAGEGPVGMAAGASGGSVTIPVFMVGNLEGAAISAQTHVGAPGSVKMTITPWSLNNRNDLGFVPSGAFGWHAFSVPSNQLRAGTNPFAYKGLNGAFVANFGTHDATNVKLHSSLSYTPTGGSSSVVYADSSAALAMFHPIDSIYVLMGNPYNFAPTGTSGSGRFDLNYTITSDSADQFAGDNSYTYSFYASDSVYSKGRYDFAKKEPVSTVHYAATGTDFTWGPMYYVAKGGSALRSIQFSLSTATAGPISLSSTNVLVWKWQDGSGGQPMDSIVENGELQLVSLNAYTFTAPGDTSNGVMNLTSFGDASGSPSATPIFLDSNSWYYVAVEVANSFFLGCDGNLSPYPRVFGRFHSTPADYIDYSSVLWANDFPDIAANPGSGNPPMPFGQISFINSIDSINYHNEIGIIPSVAMVVNNNPDTSHVVVPPISGVKEVGSSFGVVSVFPNPATDFITISADLTNTAKSVSYVVLDGLSRLVSKEIHSNVKSEKFNISTAKFAAGTYYLIVTADGKPTSKKFTVIR